MPDDGSGNVSSRRLFRTEAVAPRPNEKLTKAKRSEALQDKVAVDEKRLSKPIPDIVHVTGRWKPDELVERNRDYFPNGTEFRYYSDQDVHDTARSIASTLQKETGLTGVFEAFNFLRPWAFRIDMWRLMVLWHTGGIYMDAKWILAQPISTWVDQMTDSLALCWDIGDKWKGQENTKERRYFNGVLASQPRQQSIVEVLRHIVSQIRAHYYGEVNRLLHSDLAVTGPIALTMSLRQQKVKPRADCQLVPDWATMRQRTDWKLFKSLFSLGTKRRLEQGSGPGGGKVRGFDVDARIVKYFSNNTNITLMGSVKSLHAQQRACSDCRSYSDLVYRYHAVYCNETLDPPWDNDPCKSFTNEPPNSTAVNSDPLKYWSYDFQHKLWIRVPQLSA